MPHHAKTAGGDVPGKIVGRERQQIVVKQGEGPRARWGGSDAARSIQRDPMGARAIHIGGDARHRRQ